MAHMTRDCDTKLYFTHGTDLCPLQGTASRFWNGFPQSDAEWSINEVAWEASCLFEKGVVWTEMSFVEMRWFDWA